MNMVVRGVIVPMFDFLVRSGGGQDLAPGIADKWELAPDGLSWFFFIHKGIKFHNGEDLTAEDVKFSLDGYLSEKAIYADLRLMVDRVDIVDDYTVRVYTKGVQPFLPRTVLNDYSPNLGQVVPKDYIEKNGVEYFQRHPVGSGPFRFVRYVPGDMVEYEALDKHWRQVPAFKKLSVILIPEETTRVAMLKTGTLDAVDIDLESAFDLEPAGFRIVTLGVYPVHVFLHGAYLPQAAGMPIADIRVRQALSLAINRDEIQSSFFRGKAAPAGPPFLAASAADVDFSYWLKYSADVWRYDPEEARRLLKEAGYPQGFSIKFWSFTQDGVPYAPKLVEIIQGYWARIGVKAEIVPTDYGTFRASRVGGAGRTPVPALIGQASVVGINEMPVAGKSLRIGFAATGSYNFLVGAAFLTEVTALIDASFSETDAKKRADILAKVIKIGTDSYTALTLAAAPALVALGPQIDIDLPKPPVSSIAGHAEFAKHRKQ